MNEPALAGPIETAPVEQAEQNTPARRRMLSLAESFRVANWLKEQIERLENEQPTYEEVATQASAALELEVTAANIKTVSEASDTTWRRKPKTKPTPEQGKADVDFLLGIISTVEVSEDEKAIIDEIKERWDF